MLEISISELSETNSKVGRPQNIRNDDLLNLVQPPQAPSNYLSFFLLTVVIVLSGVLVASWQEKQELINVHTQELKEIKEFVDSKLHQFESKEKTNGIEIQSLTKTIESLKNQEENERTELKEQVKTLHNLNNQGEKERNELKEQMKKLKDELNETNSLLDKLNLTTNDLSEIKINRTEALSQTIGFSKIELYINRFFQPKYAYPDFYRELHELIPNEGLVKGVNWMLKKTANKGKLLKFVLTFVNFAHLPGKTHYLYVLHPTDPDKYYKEDQVDKLINGSVEIDVPSKDYYGPEDSLLLYYTSIEI